MGRIASVRLKRRPGGTFIQPGRSPGRKIALLVASVLLAAMLPAYGVASPSSKCMIDKLSL